MKTNRHGVFTGVLIGDELGLLKRIDVRSGEVTTLNRDSLDGEPRPDKSIISLQPFINNQAAIRPEEESDEDEEDGYKMRHDSFINRVKLQESVLFLVTSKSKHCPLSIFNTQSEHSTPIRWDQMYTESSLIGSTPVNRNNVALCYADGTVHMINVEKELLQASTHSKKKALKLLGLKADNGPCPLATPESDASTNQDDFSIVPIAIPVVTPNWSISDTKLGTFRVSGNRLAMAGRNMTLKVFDLVTNKCLFSGKSERGDWLGFKNQIWVSGLDWIGPQSLSTSSPSMITTCSRSDPIIRIYDLKAARRRKPIMSINLKDSTFNNDSNPPSFTSICSTTASPSISLPTQQIILGTTMGRMIAVDLRFNSHSSRQLGVFKGFSGGAIRDIKCIPVSNNTSRLISCSLDRFVRVHTFRMGPNKSRQLEGRHYVKTKPTCLQPLFTEENCNTENGDVEEENIMDTDEEASD